MSYKHYTFGSIIGIVMYSCYLLNESSRTTLLAKFPPKYAKVLCHHITVKFGSDVLPQSANIINVVGYMDNGDGLECLLVTVDGESKRPDGKIFHITHSLNSELGYKPVDSNNLIMNGGSVINFSPIRIQATAEIL